MKKEKKRRVRAAERKNQPVEKRTQLGEKMAQLGDFENYSGRGFA
jgi:hypothetical protein